MANDEDIVPSGGTLPALEIIEFADGTWGVTLNDYVRGGDGVSDVAVFATKDEALAFIAANVPRRH
jgi:hypothetical protein